MPPSQDESGALAPVQPAQTLPVGFASAPPAELSGMLLPTESVTFATSPHPVVFVRPVLHMIAIGIVLAVVLAWQTHPVVRGHHVSVPLVAGAARSAVLVVGALLLLREIVSLVGRLFHFLAYRVVTTNRRVFVVQGLFGRRVTPLGNTALASATMSQGLLGRMLGYGDVMMSSGPIRTVRDPVRLYREVEAVAQGVVGDTWVQPVRQTIIP
ncbi:MAG: hypothetical protein QOJ39_1064 [Candidatus Eremiobacteraeota bacterium]|jgi:hypothetical protein|nr:hypothetical protein [Candidatus Eremiobacteraeota bacterium]